MVISDLGLAPSRLGYCRILPATAGPRGWMTAHVVYGPSFYDLLRHAPWKSSVTLVRLSDVHAPYYHVSTGTRGNNPLERLREGLVVVKLLPRSGQCPRTVLSIGKTSAD